MNVHTRLLLDHVIQWVGVFLSLSFLSQALTPSLFPSSPAPSVITYSWSFFPIASSENHAKRDGRSAMIEQFCSQFNSIW